MAVTFIDACRTALADVLASDPSALVLGEDAVAGGPFGLTKGLGSRFGAAAVRNTPISENSVMGVAVGLALAGRRPFVDLMFNDFVTLASDQLFNHAAKIHYMSGGRYSVPLVVWTVGGAGTRWGAQHSQRLDGWFTQVPGLKVLAPSTPMAAAASLRDAMADPDPVVLMVDRALLYAKQSLPGDGTSSVWTPRVVRPGPAGRGVGATLVASGRLVHLALEVVERTGLDVEVIDLQCLAPLDPEPIVRSVERTGRLLVCHDEAATGGIAAAVVSAVQLRAFWSLDAPIAVVTSPPTPVPSGSSLEDRFVVGAERIEHGLRALLSA